MISVGLFLTVLCSGRSYCEYAIWQMSHLVFIQCACQVELSLIDFSGVDEPELGLFSFEVHSFIFYLTLIVITSLQNKLVLNTPKF